MINVVVPTFKSVYIYFNVLDFVWLSDTCLPKFISDKKINKTRSTNDY